MSVVFRTSRKFNLLSVRYFTFPFYSTKPEIQEDFKSQVIALKRFVKRKTYRELKPFKVDFIENLFAGVFDTDFFKYPEILSVEEFDSLLKHSKEVENTLNGSLKGKSEITEEVLNCFKKLELFGLSIPQIYGGLGYNKTETKFIQECLGANGSIGRFLANNESFGINILNQFGTEEQKLKYLPKLATGESLITFAFLEDCPLVDLTSMKTICIKEEIRNGYIIKGSKKWVQNAHMSDLLLILTKGCKLNEENVLVEYNVFVTDKSMPGITVNPLDLESAKKYNLYEVDFNNVFLPNDSLLQAEGFEILKQGMTCGNLSQAVLSLSLMKKITHNIIQNTEKLFDGKAAKEHNLVSYIQSYLGFLSTYVYVLESVIYLVSGRYDTYESPDLFLESCAAKILASDLLHLAIQKYVQITGAQSFTSSGLLEEAFEVLKHNSIFYENNEHLKLLLASQGMIKAAKLYGSGITKVRKPLDNPLDVIKWKFRKTLRNENKLNLKMELHSLFQNEADVLEECLGKLHFIVTDNLIQQGRNVNEDNINLLYFADAAIYIYALAACLGRASTAHCNYMELSRNQKCMTHIFAKIVQSKILKIHDMYSGNIEVDAVIGEEAFRIKQYPAEHPLTKTF